MAMAFPRTAMYLACFVLGTAWPGLALAQGAPDTSAVQTPSEPAIALSGFPLVKGSAFVGLTLNYTGTKHENIQPLLENVTVTSQKDMTILIDGGWFFRENATVGIALGLGGTSLSKGCKQGLAFCVKLRVQNRHTSLICYGLHQVEVFLVKGTRLGMDNGQYTY